MAIATPKGHMHTFKDIAKKTGGQLLFVCPAGFEQFFREMSFADRTRKPVRGVPTGSRGTPALVSQVDSRRLSQVHGKIDASLNGVEISWMRGW
jgi:hypothetical protein